MRDTGFSTVTEMTGYNVTPEQMRRMYTRYRFALKFCAGKDVLEVACGSGQGLGLLAGSASRVVGGDIDEKILGMARGYYKDNSKVELRLLDAHRLPFEDNAFDVVILYEAIYYLAKPDHFIKEAYRILRREGVLIICTANRELGDFNPSPYSHKYFSASELYGLLNRDGFCRVDLFGDCPVKRGTVKARLLSVIKQAFVALHLIPRTMKGKEFLKKILFGRLYPLPPEIKEGMAEYTEPQTIPVSLPDRLHKVIFAVAHKKNESHD